MTERGVDSPVTRRVLVHVGAPKSGTTYLQHVLWKNRELLARDGIGYPLDQQFEHFAATMDLRQMTWGHGFRDPAWEGAWGRVAGRARDWHGPVAVISNELLGGATAEQARRAVHSLEPAEVHVVFTARDLARQLPSDWQEQVKHAHTVTLDRFVDDLVRLGIDAPPPFGEMFWGLHDPVRVLSAWREAVPPDRIHIVTVPQPGAPRTTLWERFSSLLGANASRYETDVWSNASLGSAETEFLRLLNIRLGNRAGRHYDHLIRVRLAEKILAGHQGARRTQLPAEHHAWVLRRSQELIDGLRAAHYQVVGDLTELLPADPGTQTAPLPQDMPTAEIGAAATDALAGMLVDFSVMRTRVTRREHDLAERRAHNGANPANDRRQRRAGGV